MNWEDVRRALDHGHIAVDVVAVLLLGAVARALLKGGRPVERITALVGGIAAAYFFLVGGPQPVLSSVALLVAWFGAKLVPMDSPYGTFFLAAFVFGLAAIGAAWALVGLLVGGWVRRRFR